MKQLTVDHTWTETVTVDGAPIERERTVRLVVAEANLRLGIKRSLLIEEQRTLWDAERQTLVDQGYRLVELIAAEILRVQMYPSLVAAVVESDGFDSWPPSFEQFMDLPEALGIKWEEAVGKMNPHWIPQPEPETRDELEEARKKVMNGTSE